VSGRGDKEGQKLVAELRALRAEAAFVRTAVRVEEDVRNLVNQTVKRVGRLDVAVNNAATEALRGLVTGLTESLVSAKVPLNFVAFLGSIAGGSFGTNWLLSMIFRSQSLWQCRPFRR
jgi:NAD(P)-dependent dehydrogenase (short-subunit alcohol dehydrogenase family)